MLNWLEISRSNVLTVLFYLLYYMSVWVHVIVYCVCVCIRLSRVKYAEIRVFLGKRGTEEKGWTIEPEFFRRCLSVENSQRP